MGRHGHDAAGEPRARTEQPGHGARAARARQSRGERVHAVRWGVWLRRLRRWIERGTGGIGAAHREGGRGRACDGGGGAVVYIDVEMPRPWRRNRLDPERTVRLGSGSSVGTKETSAGRLLDTLVQQGEASGRDDDYGAAPEASAPLPDRVRGGNEGTGHLGFVLGLGMVLYTAGTRRMVDTAVMEAWMCATHRSLPPVQRRWRRPWWAWAALL